MLLSSSSLARLALAEIQNQMTEGVSDALGSSEGDGFSGAQNKIVAEQQRGAQMHVAGLKCMHGHCQNHGLRQRMGLCWKFLASPDTQQFPGAPEANCLPHKMLNTSQSALSGTQTSVVVSQLLDIIPNPLIQVCL